MDGNHAREVSKGGLKKRKIEGKQGKKQWKNKEGRKERKKENKVG